MPGRGGACPPCHGDQRGTRNLLMISFRGPCPSLRQAMGADLCEAAGYGRRPLSFEALNGKSAM